jgi:hypothetical protein
MMITKEIEMTTVQEWVDSNCGGKSSEFSDQIARYKDLEIVQEFDGRFFAFPQTNMTYRNVFNWALLSDGSSIGWNESPRSGFSFSRSGKKITQRYMEHFKEKGLL